MTKYLIFASCIALFGYLVGVVSGVHQANARESKFFSMCMPDNPNVRVIVSLKGAEPTCEKHEHLNYGMAAN